MTTQSNHKPFTAAHHGLLMAWITRQVFQRVGPVKGEMIIRKAIRRYGEQRGRRMALRVQADGKELTMLNYLIYGEWSVAPGELAQRMEQNNHHNTRMLVERCPWHATWMENDLMEYGRFYCLEIDQALVHGFNPALHLDVNKTQTNDRQACDMVFHDAPLSPANSLALMLGKKVNPGKRAILPWEYHVAHLYKAMSETLTAEMGLTGKEALDATLVEFAAHFDEAGAQVVREYQKIDFSCIPEATVVKLEAKHGYS